MAKLTLKIKILIGCAAVAAITAAVVLIAVLTGKTDAYRVLKIFELTGTAIVDRAEVGELDAYVGMNLENGDSLSVAQDSTARISLDSDKFILLDSGTVMELIAEGSETDSKTIINLVEGTILNEITEPLSENSTYEVNTPKATMAVRGTSYEVSVKKLENGSYISELNVLHGTVAVTLLDKNGVPKSEPVYVSEGFAVSIITDPNNTTNNDAAVDGNAYFVIRSQDENGEDIYTIPETDDVVYPIDYESISSNVITTVMESNERGRLSLSPQILSSINSLPTAFSLRPHSFAGFNPPVLSASAAEPPSNNSENASVPDESEEDIPDDAPDSDNGMSPINDNIPSEPSDNEGAPNDNMYNDVPADKPDENIPDDNTKADNSDSEEDDYKSEPVSDEDTSEDDFVMEEEMFIDESDDSSDDEIIDDNEDSDIAGIIPFYPPATPIQPVNPSPSPNIPADNGTFTVKFYDENENLITSVEVQSGGKVSAESFPELTDKSYYTGTWLAGDFEFTENTVVTENTDVHAVYEPVKVTIQIQRPHTVPVDTWDVKETFTAYYGETLGNVLSESRIRAQFDTVYDGGEDTYSNYRIKTISVSNLAYSESIVIDESIIYTAEDGSYYIAVGLSYAKKYNVSFTDTSGNTLTSYSVWAGDSLSSYTYPDPGVGNKWIASINFSSTEILNNHIVNSDVNAVLTPITYYVNFYDENGTYMIDQIEVGYNQTVTPFPAVPAKDGYTGRWLIYETSDEFTADTIVASDMVVIAEYTAIP